MAMINNVRNTVLAIINKNNYGYLSPQDFNLYAQQAQMDMFEDYFYQYNQYINRENVRQSGTGYADIVKGLEEVIDSFSEEVFLTGGTANTWSLPSDYYLVNKLYYYPTLLTSGTTTATAANELVDNTANPPFSDGAVTPQYPALQSIVVNTDTLKQAFVQSVANATTINLSDDIFQAVASGENYSIYDANNITEVERVTQKKIFFLTSSTLGSPTTQFPAYVLSGNTVSVYPTSIQNNGDIKAQYIRYPKPPQWTFLSLTNGEPIFDQTSSTYQDFELPLSDEPGLIAKICQYVGIEIREAEVYQFGQNEEVQDNQIQV
tara:strand:- start:8402 stop:9361 length:960 start_codon:yes stop_codon:yes gene_type:complete